MRRTVRRSRSRVVAAMLLAAGVALAACGTPRAVTVPRSPSTTVPRPSTTVPPASGATVSSVPPSAASGPVYLALGDSAPMWDGNASYPDLIAAHERSSVPGLQLVNLSVSGATTSSMLSGTTRRSGSEEHQAVAFLDAHRGSVALVTIDIGGNDVLACGTGSPSCLTRVEAKTAANLTTILSRLRAAAGPSVPIVGMTYYDPYLGDWMARGADRAIAVGSVSYLAALNALLTRTYRAAGASVADVQGAFDSTDLTTLVSSPWGTIPLAVDRACTLLDMRCVLGAPAVGSDPTTSGAAVIAGAFETAIGTLGRPS